MSVLRVLSQQKSGNRWLEQLWDDFEWGGLLSDSEPLHCKHRRFYAQPAEKFESSRALGARLGYVKPTSYVRYLFKSFGHSS